MGFGGCPGWRLSWGLAHVQAPGSLKPNSRTTDARTPGSFRDPVGLKSFRERKRRRKRTNASPGPPVFRKTRRWRNTVLDGPRTLPLVFAFSFFPQTASRPRFEVHVFGRTEVHGCGGGPGVGPQHCGKGRAPDDRAQALADLGISEDLWQG